MTIFGLSNLSVPTSVKIYAGIFIGLGPEASFFNQPLTRYDDKCWLLLSGDLSVGQDSSLAHLESRFRSDISLTNEIFRYRKDTAIGIGVPRTNKEALI